MSTSSGADDSAAHGPSGQAASQSSRAARAGAAARKAGQRTAKAAQVSARRVRRLTTAEGAGESGLFKLIELHGVNAAGDALLAAVRGSTTCTHGSMPMWSLVRGSGPS